MLVKKKLLELPIHTFPEKVPKTQNNVTKDFYYAAEISEEILHMTLFDWDSQEPTWKVFYADRKWINYNLQEKRWGKATIDHIGRTPSEMWRDNTFRSLDKASEQAGEIFFAIDQPTPEALRRAQYKQQSEVNAKQAERRKARRDECFANWPELPAGFTKRLEDTVWKDSKYCFFRKCKKDDLSLLDALIERELPGTTAEYIGECSACNKSFPLDYTPTHDGSPIICPHCGSMLTPKKAGLGRGKLKVYAWYLVASERDGIIYADVLNCWRYYETAPYRTSFESCYRYLFNTNTGDCLMWTDRYWRGWEQNKTLREPPNLAYEVDQSFWNALQYTCLQHSKEYFLNGRLLKSVGMFTKYPCTEILCKVGMKRQVQELIAGYSWNRQCLNLKGSTLYEVTGLTKPQREFVAKHQLGGFSLLIYKRLVQEKQPYTEEDLKLTSNLYGYKQELLKLLDQSGTRRGLNYIQKQKSLHPTDRTDDIITFWRDYLNECRILDYDLSDRYNLMPPDLRKAHAKTMQLVTQKKNKANDAKIARRLPELEERYHFEADGLLIRPARNAGELVAEGTILHHCVGTYVERYAKGETNILFVRKAEEPEGPFVTTEYRGTERKQAYADYNQRPSKEVLAFLDKFEQHLKNPKKESVAV